MSSRLFRRIAGIALLAALSSPVAAQSSSGNITGEAKVGDTVTITGVALHAPAEPLYGHNDHRIVMALAVAVYAAGLPALLRGAEAVNKSWPAFWDTLRGLGAKIDTE